MNLKLIGNLLISAQFGALAVLALQAWDAWQPAASHAPAWLLLCVSGMVGLWALSANRLGNFNIHPTPHPQGQLVVHGPYRWIRHPMYTAVLLFGAALAILAASSVAWPLWCLLLASQPVEQSGALPRAAFFKGILHGRQGLVTVEMGAVLHVDSGFAIHFARNIPR